MLRGAIAAGSTENFDNSREPCLSVGQLIPVDVQSTKKNTIDHLTLEDDINVRTKSDNRVCIITGCAVLSSSKLVLADFNNTKVKVVSVENKIVQEEKIIDANPFDIAVTAQDEFAVTIPHKGRIDVIRVGDKLSLVLNINVNRECCSIASHQNLYVVCLDPSCVVVLTTQGDILNTIPLNFFTSDVAPYIAVRKDSHLLYISDYDNNIVVSVSLQGDIVATYRHEELQQPLGLCLLDDGSLLVCCYVDGTIYQVKDDFKEGKIRYKDLIYPESICYSAPNDEVYVGRSGDQLNILSTK